jgi:hypothetical protein
VTGYRISTGKSKGGAKADNAMIAEKLPRKKYGFFRFSVRRLWIGITILCILFGLFGRRIYNAHHQGSAVAKIAAAGGDVYYEGSLVRADDKWEPRFIERSEEDPGSLGNYLGLGGFTKVSGVKSAYLRERQGAIHDKPLFWAGFGALRPQMQIADLWLEKFDEFDAEQLAAAGNLQYLALHVSGKCDPDLLRPLSRCANLITLHLDLEEITDKHMAVLSEFPALQELTLSKFGSDKKPRLEITEKGMKKLAALDLHRLTIGPWELSQSNGESLQQLKGLRQVELVLGKGDHTGFAQLKKLPELKEVTIRGGGLKVQAYQEVFQIPKLAELTVSMNPINDTWLSLTPPREVRRLNLQNCQMNDETLAALQQWPALEKISIYPFVFSHEAVENFHAARPSCVLNFGNEM